MKRTIIYFKGLSIVVLIASANTGWAKFIARQCVIYSYEVVWLEKRNRYHSNTHKGKKHLLQLHLRGSSSMSAVFSCCNGTDTGIIGSAAAGSLAAKMPPLSESLKHRLQKGRTHEKNRQVYNTDPGRFHKRKGKR